MSSKGSESDGSDIQMQSALPKKPQKKLPNHRVSNNPSDDLLKKRQDKKVTTKIMIQQALIDLKSRKGVSLYAIKKYISERYNVDAEKLNYHIKKFIKSAVEKGIITQTKGIGATGSFKLAPIKEKKSKTKKTKTENTEKTKDPEKKKKIKEKLKKAEKKSLKSKVKSKESKGDKPIKPKKKKKKMDTEKMPEEKKDGGEKTTKLNISKVMQTPKKKKGMMKRKSISSIIKPPKMKPRAKA